MSEHERLAVEIINFIIMGNLMIGKCADDPEHGCMVVWSANAHDQLAAFLKNYE